MIGRRNYSCTDDENQKRNYKLKSSKFIKCVEVKNEKNKKKLVVELRADTSTYIKWDIVTR